MKVGYPRPRRAAVLPALRAMAENGRVRASSREIAAVAGVSHWTVQEALLDLECRGAIEVVRRGGSGGRRAPGEYRLSS